ncbi:nuclear transport factor 2 family protein [Arcticibacter sp. MXS-1]|uniref:nuclear transport factor 2 family protein n=1 Tax=Arcticibacter sp. MXS-1 TaxID=3341726 RepID=UPI0035A950E7
MKRVALMLTAIYFGITLSSFAADENSKERKLTVDYAIQTYVDALTEGKVKLLNEVLDADVKFSVAQGDKMENYTREQILEQVRRAENVKQNCTAEYTLVDQNLSQAIYKVVFDYQSFKKVNFVTVVQTKKGWKLTNVSVSYK